MQHAAALANFESFSKLTPDEMTDVVRSGARADATLPERARIFTMLGRPRTCVPGMLAYALGLAYVQPSMSAAVIIGFVLCFLGGFVANIGNTYTDLPEDTRNLPGRVYLMAKLGYRQLFWLLMGCYAAMVGAAAYCSLAAGVMMVVALIIVHEYSFPPLRAKDGTISGLIVFAQVVAFPFFVAVFTDPDLALLYALASADGTTAAHAFQAERFIAMLLFVEVWFIAKGFFKNVPDFYGDRDAGLRTSATIFRTWRGAATTTAIVTVLAYASLAVPVALGLESPRLLFALLWLIPVTWNCVRLVGADDGAIGNQCLKTDMVISVGFIATVVLLVSPTVLSAVAIAAGVAVILSSDLLRVDSRRDVDTAAATAAVAANGAGSPLPQASPVGRS